MRVVVDFGATNTGQTPTLATWKRLDTLADVGSPPAFSEIGATGMYVFTWSPAAADPDMVYIADCGAGAPDSANRYRRGVLRVYETFFDQKLSDIYGRLGAPAGASHAADIAAVKTDTGNTYTRLGAPAGATTAADIAAIQTKLGAPAGASVSADIAANATTIGNVSSIVTGIQTLVTTGDGKLDTLTTNLAAAKTVIDSISAAVAAVSAALTGVANQATAIKTELDGVVTTQGDHTTDIAAVQTAVDAVVPAVQGSGGKTITDVDTKLGAPAGASVSVDVAAVLAAIASLSSSIDLTPLLASLTTTQGLVTGMDAAVGTMSTAVDNMTTTVEGFAAGLQRALGMLHENSVLDRCVYTETNELRSARLRIYDTKDHSNAAADALPDDYDTGKIAEYVIKAGYNGANLTSYLMTREFPLA